MLFKSEQHYILVLQKDNYLHGRNVNCLKRKVECNVRKYNYSCYVYNTRKYIGKHTLIYSLKNLNHNSFCIGLVSNRRENAKPQKRLCCLYLYTYTGVKPDF